MAKKKLKIAFLSFYSGIVNRGVETFVHELANELSYLGHDITVYQAGGELPNSKYKTITIKTDVNWKEKASYTPFVNYFAKKVRQFSRKALKNISLDTDIVFPTNGQWQSIYSRIWSARYSKKCIMVGQSGPGRDDKINLLCFPHTFVALTQFQMEWAKRINPFVPVTVIPNGVDLEKFTKSGSKIELDLPKPIILSVSALIEWKRIDLTIKAVSKIPNASLLIVGKSEDSEFEKNLRKLANELLPKRHRFESYPHHNMPEVYRSADVFTYSTVPWESFGIVMLEAMSTNLPVVAVDDPIRREIVGNAGLFVDPHDTNAYAKSLEEAIARKWGNTPREHAQEFSWKKIAIDYEKLFNKLVK